MWPRENSAGRQQGPAPARVSARNRRRLLRGNCNTFCLFTFFPSFFLSSPRQRHASLRVPHWRGFPPAGAFRSVCARAAAREARPGALLRRARRAAKGAAVVVGVVVLSFVVVADRVTCCALPPYKAQRRPWRCFRRQLRTGVEAKRRAHRQRAAAREREERRKGKKKRDGSWVETDRPPVFSA